jgi:uncharacterized membrane protein
MAPEPRPSRLAFVDAARGLAVLLMLQTHVYDAWLRPELRDTDFFRASQLLGGLPGAFFLFLMGVSTALAAQRSRDRGVPSSALVRRTLGRAGLLLGVAFAFRLSMYFASDHPEIDAIFKVDILNCLAVSLALLAPVGGLTNRNARVCTSIGVAAWFAIATSFMWDGGIVAGLPERFAGYFTGRVTNTTFPLFPWAAFAFAGHAVGARIASARGDALNGAMSRLVGAAALAIPLSIALDQLPTLGPHYDYWWTSPNFVMLKTSVLMFLLLACFWFEQLHERAGTAVRSVMGPISGALVQMGRTSLFIYCVHVDLVYGSRAFPDLWKACEIDQASRLLLALTLAMLVSSYAWSWIKTKASAGPARLPPSLARQ